MKKIAFTISLIFVTLIICAQVQPLTWSGAAGVKPSHSITPPLSDAPTPIPPGSLLWSQGPGCISEISSEVISSFGVETNCADDFTFTTTSNVIAARWWFGYFNGGYTPFISWNITIYDNGACLPGNIVQQWTIPFDLSHEAFNCNDINGGGIYSYWADLTSAFVAAPNTKYWISIQVGDHPFLPGQWGWDHSTTITGCEGAFKSDFFGYPFYSPISALNGAPLDLSFELYGTGAPPTPVSNWALFIGIGLILVATAVRFRRIL